MHTVFSTNLQRYQDLERGNEVMSVVVADVKEKEWAEVSIDEALRSLNVTRQAGIKSICASLQSSLRLMRMRLI